MEVLVFACTPGRLTFFSTRTETVWVFFEDLAGDFAAAIYYWILLLFIVRQLSHSGERDGTPRGAGPGEAGPFTSRPGSPSAPGEMPRIWAVSLVSRAGSRTLRPAPRALPSPSPGPGESLLSGRWGYSLVPSRRAGLMERASGPRTP